MPLETAFTTCTSPKAYAGLAERTGGYTFQVRARDTANNVDATPAQQSFLVDATGPTITISAPVANATVGTSVTLTFTTEAPGYVHLLLTLGVFLLIWRIAVRGTRSSKPPAGK